MTQASVLVVVPTTGGPLVLRGLTARPGMPTSAAFAVGDYRPLPWSGDYARLAAEGGPLSRLPGITAGPYELRLSGSFDAGRSWEVPVCLAHGLVARGFRLTPEPSEADLVVWATGAVDLDLAVLAADYALLDKIERSRDLMTEAARADLYVLLPSGPEAAQAERIFRALPRARPSAILPSASIPAALAALVRGTLPTVATAGRRRRAPPAVAAGLVIATALVAILMALDGHPTKERPEAPPALAEVDAVKARPATLPDGGAPPPGVEVEELVAPAGSSCRRVAFGADPPERRAVPSEASGRLRASRLASDLCGLAFRLVRPGARLAVDPALAAAALPPVRLPDGAQAYFLREGSRQNLVYVVQALSEAGVPSASDRLEHALRR
ncbi:hypothetical protein [Methylobacterium sp. Leaf112]|uniref:hypothetical protein n=1 Tax=Methylobacterium sp. Leaf112 TaxID=1736258 RepID=UPI0006FA4655|nr:hypothetical protein [Methylobacterium sp. Leaf112]KQP70790.1 hypothetical protein ASF52_15465 [Methylobacterium sp. Leaf112]